ncbi:P-loop NTPase fold protein [Geotalea sp. SG265]|uniref:KAP family P-loop NTPase fold protein n=1 Tax=Geotalea sp. SG265 TaxID=2922867 RepID=UPI001FAF373F|nr:P-loop NTPase fold protein [Geotalea sp. SG265]
MWPDNETKNDLLGFKVHSDLVRTVITNPAMLPTTIGVFGDWGGGKTSIMKMLEWDLEPENWPEGSPERKQCETTAVVYVNTWLFEGYDDAKSALLTAVIKELAEHKRFGPKIRDAAISLLEKVDLMRMVRFGLKYIALPAAAAAASGGLTAVPAAIALSSGLSSLTDSSKPESCDDEEEEKEKPDTKGLLKEKSTDKKTLDIRTFRKKFKKMLSDGGISSLVVLVDDLDRCTPERIIDNLEAVKLFLSVEQTAFVIGADPRIVEHAIRNRYAEFSTDNIKNEDTQRLVKDYLEKLVQVPYSLPRLSSTEIETYMTLLFCQKHLEAEQFNICIKACNEKRSTNRYSSFGYFDARTALGIPELESDFSNALAFSASIAPLIADGLKGNPRQVKRFLNALMLRKQLAYVARLENIKDSVLVKLMILEYVHPELFAQVYSWQSQQNGYPKELAELEEAILGAAATLDSTDAVKKDSKWATAAVRRWVVTEPRLRDVDLRDYFWVARDRLETTFSGVAMVSPVVRRVLDDLVSGLAPKRNAAMKTAQTLDPDEIANLLTLISQQILRQPGEKIGFDAIRFLIEADIDQAAEVMASCLLQCPLDKVNPAVGMDIITVSNAKPRFTEILKPAIEHLSRSTTPVGRAVQRAIKPKER